MMKEQIDKEIALINELEKRIQEAKERINAMCPLKEGDVFEREGVKYSFRRATKYYKYLGWEVYGSKFKKDGNPSKAERFCGFIKPNGETTW